VFHRFVEVVVKMIGEMFDQFLWWTRGRRLFKGSSLRLCFSKEFTDLAIDSVIVDFSSFGYEKKFFQESYDGSESYVRVFLYSLGVTLTSFVTFLEEIFKFRLITPRRIVPVCCFFRNHVFGDVI